MIELNKFYDKIYCITLTKDESRMQNVLNLAKKLNIDIIICDAITPTVLDIPNNIKCLPTEYACAQSHIALWRKIVKDKPKRPLILEDDVILNKSFNFSTLVDNKDILTNTKTDISFLGLNYRDRAKLIPISENIYKVEYAFALHAYSPTVKFLENVLYKIDSEDYRGQIDMLMANLYNSINAYTIHPPMFIQKNGYSFIQQRNVNYDKFLM